ncbi:MAG TPA: clostripain-related cysteine peptidase, partial [Candidatus Ozemobacteraceae bacterium]|nr:clostripain-related cysteine peptidase [Candidatus Ozemobacteraceae bacterium]
DEYGVLDQEEMAVAGSSDKLDIVTMIDRYAGPATMNHIEKGRVVKLTDEGELDMGDWHELVRFAKTAMARFPAKHYALVVWNHGAGWKFKGAALKGISYDDSSKNHITTNQLGDALSEISSAAGRKIDLFCMDACLMQMFEVAWALRDGCDYIVASEETVPGDGYPYTEVLRALRPGMTPVEFGAAIVKAFRDCYSKDIPQEGPWEIAARGDLRVIKRTTMSLLETARLPELRDRLDVFCRAVMAGNHAAALNAAIQKVEHFSYAENVDLKDLLDILKTTVKDAALLDAIVNLGESFKRAIPANGTTGTNDDGQMPGGDDPDDLAPARRWPMPICANGLAVYFPEKASKYSPAYEDLAFAADTQWDEMLLDHFRKSAAARVAADLDRGSLDGLREWLNQSGPMTREISRAVMETVGFRLHTEGGLPPSLADEARVLLDALRKR